MYKKKHFFIVKVQAIHLYIYKYQQYIFIVTFPTNSILKLNEQCYIL